MQKSRSWRYSLGPDSDPKETKNTNWETNPETKRHRKQICWAKKLAQNDFYAIYRELLFWKGKEILHKKLNSSKTLQARATFSKSTT